MASCIRYLGCAVVLTVSLLAPRSAHGGFILPYDDSKRKETLHIPAGTRDIHFAVAGLFNKEPTGLPEADRTDNHAIGTASNRWSFGYNDPLVKQDATVTFSRSTPGAWNLQIWYTDDFKHDGQLVFPTTPPSTTLASLYIKPEVGGFSVFGETQATVEVENITVTVVSGLSSYDAPDWDTVSGNPYSLGNVTLSPGPSDIAFGPFIPAEPTDWVRISADFGGSTSVFGYEPAAVPEPSTAISCAIAVACVLVYTWRCHRRSAVNPLT